MFNVALEGASLVNAFSRGCRSQIQFGAKFSLADGLHL